jgi:hypothetical protein
VFTGALGDCVGVAVTVQHCHRNTNPALAALAMLPPIAGISGAMISYIHKMGALHDAAQRFSKASKWSTATSDVDQDPLILDLDGDGIETRSMDDAANDNLPQIWEVT